VDLVVGTRLRPRSRGHRARPSWRCSATVDTEVRDDSIRFPFDRIRREAAARARRT